MAEVAVIQNRPWIGFDANGINSDPLVIDNRGWISTFVSTAVRNFGNVPGSIPGTVFANLVVTDIAHGSAAVSERLKQAMNGGLPKGIGPSATLFPGGAKGYVNSTFVTPTQITPPNATNLEAFLVGGLVYTDPVGMIHHLAFSYSYQVPGNIPRAVVFGLTPRSTVPNGTWIEYRTLVD